MAHTLMIQGTCSDAGKSLLVTALCRIYARRGYKVSPFKSQNMALNSFVTPQGFEIGRAQAVQAHGAMREPHIDMNPVLLKPEGNQTSQVILMGKPWKTLKAREYYKAKPELWKEVCQAMDRLQQDNDIIIAEGAGSPAEINLKAHEIVNMAVARYLKAPVLLTGDIDRGGVFASLYGTLALADEDRHMIKGFLINKFRGDVSLLEPGLKMLEERCNGVKTLGVIPYIPKIFLAQEDSVFLQGKTIFGDPKGLEIGVLKLPHLANYDDFDPFLRDPHVKLHFIETLGDMEKSKAIIIPGTKTTIKDLLWLKEQGLFKEIKKKAQEGTPIIGICGGYQMMGKSIEDSLGLEGISSKEEGLGLLQISTQFDKQKETSQTQGRLEDGSIITGYEIHMGQSIREKGVKALYEKIDSSYQAIRKEGAMSQDNLHWGSYLHGIFDNRTFRHDFLKTLGWIAPEESGPETSDLREEELERIANIVQQSLNMKEIDTLLGL